MIDGKDLRQQGFFEICTQDGAQQINSTEVRTNLFSDYLNKYKKRIITVNLPFTQPPSRFKSAIARDTSLQKIAT